MFVLPGIFALSSDLREQNILLLVHKVESWKSKENNDHIKNFEAEHSRTKTILYS